MLLSLILACAQEDLPVHHLAMGGDVMLGRRLNLALAQPDRAADIFAAVKPRLAGADLTLVNAEGVIALGGTYADKGEPRPHQHHAMAEAAAVLADAGVDVVTMGNNHAGDYGPAALVEARDRLMRVGIDVAGAGEDLEEARSPVYRQVGDVVVAIVGVELTGAGKHAAQADRAGIFHLDGAVAKARDQVVAELVAVAAEARRHAHVVILSPHWGENFVTAPTPLMQDLAHAAIDGGYDAILGHSAHAPHGVEVYRGRPIVYDAGNLVMDYGGDDESHQGMLYDVAFTRAGVASVSALPVFLEPNHTIPATGTMLASMLKNWVSRSEALGTTVRVADGVGTVTCEPGGVEGPPVGVAPPRRPTPDQVRLAPDETMVPELPASARPLSVSWPELGLELLGSEVLLDRLRIPKSGNVIRLYLRASRPLPPGLLIRISNGDDGNLDDHLPGDWILPADRWPIGAIVQDRYLIRMVGTPSGTVTYRAGVVVDREVVPATAVGVPTQDGLVELGTATWAEGAPRLFEVLATDPRGRLGQ